MEAWKKENELISAMADHERVIARFYLACAERFRDEKGFWGKLAEEEYQHAHWLNRLKNRTQNDEGFGGVAGERFSITDVRLSHDSIKRMTDALAEPDFDMEKALDAALRIEESLIEKEYFKVFEGDPAEINQVLYYLEEATRTHIARIQKRLSQNQ